VEFKNRPEGFSPAETAAGLATHEQDIDVHVTTENKSDWDEKAVLGDTATTAMVGEITLAADETSMDTPSAGNITVRLLLQTFYNNIRHLFTYFSNGVANEAAKTTGTLVLGGHSFNGSEDTEISFGSTSGTLVEGNDTRLFGGASDFDTSFEMYANYLPQFPTSNIGYRNAPGWKEWSGGIVTVTNGVLKSVLTSGQECRMSLGVACSVGWVIVVRWQGNSGDIYGVLGLSDYALIAGSWQPTGSWQTTVFLNNEATDALNPFGFSCASDEGTIMISDVYIGPPIYRRPILDKLRQGRYLSQIRGVKKDDGGLLIFPPLGEMQGVPSDVFGDTFSVYLDAHIEFSSTIISCLLGGKGFSIQATDNSLSITVGVTNSSSALAYISGRHKYFVEYDKFSQKARVWIDNENVVESDISTNVSYDDMAVVTLFPSSQGTSDTVYDLKIFKHLLTPAEKAALMKDGKIQLPNVPEMGITRQEETSRVTHVDGLQDALDSLSPYLNSNVEIMLGGEVSEPTTVVVSGFMGKGKLTINFDSVAYSSVNWNMSLDNNSARIELVSPRMSGNLLINNSSDVTITGEIS
jgi:hypothetical protein